MLVQGLELKKKLEELQETEVVQRRSFEMMLSEAVVRRGDRSVRCARPPVLLLTEITSWAWFTGPYSVTTSCDSIVTQP